MHRTTCFPSFRFFPLCLSEKNEYSRVSQVGCCRHSLRANPRFLAKRTHFSTRVHAAPVSVYRKQVLSIRRGKINKWRSWCSPGPGCLPLSNGAYRVFTSVKTGSVNMHVLCINTERSPMLLLSSLILSLSFSRFPVYPHRPLSPYE